MHFLRHLFIRFVVLLCFALIFSGTFAYAQESTEVVTPVDITPEVTETLAPTSEATAAVTPPSPEVTAEATAEITETLAPEVTAEATDPPTSPAAPSAPPVFLLQQTTFETPLGQPLLIEFQVSDEAGIVRVAQDIGSTLGQINLEQRAPTETAQPYFTHVTLTYVPPAEYTGADSFTLKAINAAGDTTSTAITVNIGVTAEATLEATAEATLEATAEVTAEAGEEGLLAAKTFIVNNTGDASDANTADGICATAGAVCTLRAAFEQANTNVGKDTVRFNIPGAGPHVITLGAFVFASESIVIDGTTQPGYSGTPVIGVTGGSSSIAISIIASSSIVKGLALYNYPGAAVYLVGDNNTVTGNYIGFNTAGVSANGASSRWGVYIEDGSNNNIIGGTNAAARNIIGGNADQGIFITGATASGNLIQGNYIGLNPAGTAAVANGDADPDDGGVTINDSPDNIVGGTSAGARNIISGNVRNGVFVTGTNAINNRIQGNYIGLNAAGTNTLGNLIGIGLESSTNIVGGTSAGARNIISGNDFYGLLLSGGDADANHIQGNYIGTDATGKIDLGNGFYGIEIQLNAERNIIGGVTAATRNVISGNDANGISIDGGHRNVISGNYIGTTVDGKSALSNLAHGIYVDGLQNHMGGSAAGAGNVIAFNGGDGVYIESGDFNGVQGNAIHSNGGLGIDLGTDGVTANDDDDPDTGANNLQNFPLIDDAVAVSGGVRVIGSYNSVASGTYVLEFFANTSCDSSGNGEGQQFIGRTIVTANSAGNVSFDATFKAKVAAGSFITGTAYVPSITGYRTSEFSACRLLSPVKPLAAPGTIAPRNRVTVDSGTPTFSWRAVTGTTTYQLQLGSDADFIVVPYTCFTPTTSCITFGLQPMQTYYWRVRAFNSDNVPGAWSRVSTFTYAP